MRLLDIAAQGLTAEFFSLDVTDATLTSFPVSPIPVKVPYSIVLIKDACEPGVTVTAMSWQYAATVNTPQVTVTYSTAMITRKLTFAVLYKV